MSTAESRPASDRPSVIVMGVSGCGKSTVGAALAEALGALFVDGDALHPAANIEKMRTGIPLQDDDRWPWFEEIAKVLLQGHRVVACSALKVCYRDFLRQRCPQLRFVFLDGSPELMASRVAARPSHFMPASLVASQFATLERPDGEQGVVTVAADAPLADIIRTYQDYFLKDQTE